MIVTNLITTGLLLLSVDQPICLGGRRLDDELGSTGHQQRGEEHDFVCVEKDTKSIQLKQLFCFGLYCNGGLGW